MADKIEFKCATASQNGCNIKVSGDGESMTFEGYLACFDNVDSYGDVILKGAFAKTIVDHKDANMPVPILQQHGTMGSFSGDDTPIGHFVEMREDATGLWVKGQLYSHTRGTDMYKLLKEAPQGFMGMSIGYRTIAQKFTTEEEFRKTGVVRYLTEIELREGSIVTFPANQKARVTDVKADAAMRWRAMEKHFRENGFSASKAKEIISLIKAFDVSGQLDPEVDAPKIPDGEIQQLTEAVKAVKSSLDILSAQGAVKSFRSFVDTVR